MKKPIIVSGNFAEAPKNFISLKKKTKENQTILTTEASVQQILARAINPKIMKIDRSGSVCKLFKT